jgi:ribosomal protein L7/L12
MADLEQIVTQLSDLTVIEAAELSKLLEEKWGVSAAAPAALAVAGDAAGDAAAEEQSEFTVVLTAAGDKKILELNLFKFYSCACSFKFFFESICIIFRNTNF